MSIGEQEPGARRATVRCHLCDCRVLLDSARWTLPFDDGPGGRAPEMAVAEVQAGAAGAMPTCPACAAVHAYQPAQADVKAAQARMAPGTREERYRQCVTRRKHTVADTATVGVRFCAACLTTFALGKALDAPGQERAPVPVPVERPRAGDLMILEHADGAYGVYRLSHSGERVFVRRGFATPGEAWEAARGELGVQARLWVGHADDPDNLQAY